LPAEDLSAIPVISGPLTEELLKETWFGVTIISTVAVECALRGIPCFLCGWLKFWPYGYVQQFSRFGVGQVLSSVAEIAGIPQMLEKPPVRPDVARDLWQAISAERFRELVEGDCQANRLPGKSAIAI
jgi:hypothetical protein